MSDFNPNSTDAVLSRILEKLEAQNTAAAETRGELFLVLREIRDEAKKTNGRVSALERWRAELRSKTAILATVASSGVAVVAWLIDHLWR